MTEAEKQDTVKQVLQKPSLITRELNNRSLYQFLLWAWPEISGDPFVGNWHIPYLCEELEKVAFRVGDRQSKLHDLLINVPPGSTKTRICSIAFPVWCWTKWHWIRIISASYSLDLALESAEYSRNLIRSERFKQVYPELEIQTDKDSKGNYRIVKYNKKGVPSMGGSRYTTSVGGTLTGFHGDILIWDDALNPKQAMSDNLVQAANHWLDESLSTRKTSRENTVTIGIMQRLRQDDPTGHLLDKQKDNLHHICVPGEIRNYKHLVKPKKLIKYYKNDLFDENRMSWNVLEELEKDLGQYGYAGQIGQNPAPAGGGMFKVDHFQYTSELFPKNQIARSVRYWDKASVQGGKGAFTCGVKIDKLKNGKFLVDDVKRGRWSTERRERIIRQTAEADGQHVFIVVEQEPGSGGKESAEATIRNLAGFSASKERPIGDKVFRADPFSVQVNNGNVLLRTAQWNRDYVDEFELFPNSMYKDQVDASSGGFQFLARKKEIRRIT